ncbi:hypothetical protein BGZ73_005896 [Actinomortierella ambigua]|nr:hypothetical protein BGZ73_005896 [Actinomortierella ambigua]
MKGRIGFHVLCLLAVVATSAGEEPLIPLPRSAASYAKYHNKLYIHGGYANGQTIPFRYLYALDLSKPWKSQTPAWIRISEGPNLYNNRTYSTMSADGKVLMIIPGETTPSWLYFFETGQWNMTNAPFRNSMMDAFPVTLATNNSVLITGGTGKPFSGVSINEYDVYSFVTHTTKTDQLPATVSGGRLFMPNRQHYRAVWSDYLQKAVLYGGESETDETTRWVSDTLDLYDPKTGQWSEMVRTVVFSKIHLTNGCSA